MGIEEMNVIGDSLIVIREARYIYKNWKTPNSNRHRMLLCLVKEFKNIIFLHVWRRENQHDDCMENKGANLNCEVMEKDSVINENVWIPWLLICFSSVLLGHFVKILALSGWAYFKPVLG